jgi:hypothetical protein
MRRLNKDLLLKSANEVDPRKNAGYKIKNAKGELQIWTLSGHLKSLMT